MPSWYYGYTHAMMTCYSFFANPLCLTIHAVGLARVSLQCGRGGDDVHDVDRAPGEGHPIAPQPLAEPLRLGLQLLQLILILK